jgi:tetratricopeptide (TPR) repeat protein
MEQARTVRLQAVAIWERLTRDYPDRTVYTVGLGGEYCNVGLTLEGNPRAQLEWFDKAIETLEAFLRKHPDEVTAWHYLANSYGNRGLAQSRAGDPEHALESHGKAIEAYLAVARKDPRDAGNRRGLATTYMNRAIALDQLHRYREAIADWQRVVNYSDGPERDSNRRWLITDLLRWGESERAIAQVKALAQSGFLDGGGLLNQACDFSRASACAREDVRVPLAVRETAAERYAACAMGLLKQVDATDWFRNRDQAKALKTNKDLDALRSRDEFQSLVADVDRRLDELERRSRQAQHGPPLEGHRDAVQCVAWGPGHAGSSAGLLATGSRDRTVKLWDPVTHQVLRTLEGHGAGVRSVAFSPDGRRLLSGGEDGTVRLWDVATGTPLRRFEGHAGAVNAVAFAPDGRRGLSGGEDKTARLWDLEAGPQLRRFAHPALVTSVAFAPDGHRLASGTGAASLHVWDAANGRELHRFTAGTDSWVTGVAFSPDGLRALCAGGKGSTLQLWDLATDKSLRTFRGHAHFVNSLALSADGLRLLSGALDRTFRLWDVATGRELFIGYCDAPVRGVALSPDGRFALTCCDNTKTAQQWELPPAGED